MILIYSEEITSRLDYISKVIFKQILRTEIALTTNPAYFLKSELPKINYSNNKFGDEIYIKPHGLLLKTGVEYVDIKPVKYDNETYFLESSIDSILPFDPFSAAFYLVTRFEEYLETDFDKFGRFQASKSILSKFNLVKKPVVNIWADLIAKEIEKKYPGFLFPKRKFEFISTIDIDNAWAFLHK